MGLSPPRATAWQRAQFSRAIRRPASTVVSAACPVRPDRIIAAARSAPPTHGCCMPILLTLTAAGATPPRINARQNGDDGEIAYHNEKKLSLASLMTMSDMRFSRGLDGYSAPREPRGLDAGQLMLVNGHGTAAGNLSCETRARSDRHEKNGRPCARAECHGRA